MGPRYLAVRGLFVLRQLSEKDAYAQDVLPLKKQHARRRHSATSHKAYGEPRFSEKRQAVRFGTRSV